MEGDVMNLSNTTFIIPLRIESDDRLRNVIVSSIYLLDNTDCQIIVKESDKTSVFAENALPQIRECVGDKADRLTHVFEENQEELAKLLVAVVRGFWKEAGILHGYTGFRLKHIWIQQYNEGHSHRLHVHGPLENDWSFVYYVECNDDSAETVFYNYGYPYVDHHHYKIKPKKGRCVLFPGAMPHEAMPNKEDTRLVISGNIAFERDK